MTTANKSEQSLRSALTAAIGFPAIVILAGVLGWATPGIYAPISPHILPLLGVIMFGMGLTLRPGPVIALFKRPWILLVGSAAQFIIMPIAGWAVAEALGLPAALAIGVIMVGASPGGTASNVVAYLAKGDVALSVGLTTLSTLLAPILTPAWVLYLGGTSISVSFAKMSWTVVQVVLLPVIGGFIVHLLLPKLVAAMEPILPWASAITVAVVLGSVVAGSSASLSTVGPLVFLAVVIHNLIGMSIGYGVARACKLDRAARRTMAIEVGMQNSGLASGLAKTFVPAPEAAVAGAIFSVWHNVSGSIYAGFARYWDSTHATTSNEK
ncbi:Bile acid:sodium symporter [Boudabousia tangfeifanii]|uniref:Bile acid:sodium symporter n=1 Tax=Boudabousia tangfeifanii TaxID=1912795 RepID=A0A1D9MLV1_9ACTO|nr:bile acid:sodium symporter family protein [Boudabousia tangfeifanii]AOZ73276.1 Bile acid:sodium symporter [Boudabousia tangfeifanii]